MMIAARILGIALVSIGSAIAFIGTAIGWGWDEAVHDWKDDEE